MRDSHSLCCPVSVTRNRVRGMVVGEGGRSSGVLLYCRTNNLFDLQLLIAHLSSFIVQHLYKKV